MTRVEILEARRIARDSGFGKESWPEEDLVTKPEQSSQATVFNNETPEQDDHEIILSEDSLAVELGQCGFDADARFVAEWDQWLFWDGKRWVKASYIESRSRVRDFLRLKANEVLTDARDEAQFCSAKEAQVVIKRAERFAEKMGEHRKITAVEQVTRTNRASIAEASSFDSNSLLLGTPEGTVCLRTGILRAAERSDNITKFTSVSPAPSGTQAPRWVAFLGNVFPLPDGAPDLEMICFIQRLAGYSLTGETSEQKLAFFYGTGRNGKGTIVQTLADISGEYSKTVSSSLFVQTMGEAHPTGMAQLRGQRLVAANEIPKNATWNEEVIKTLTGGDVISARFMRQDFFEFRPNLTLIISGNNKPRFKGVGISMRERFLLVPFTQNFTDENGKRDPYLAEKLKSEWPAIMRWCIEGAIEWQRQGLNPPDSVKAASVDYLDEEDGISAFVLEHLIPDTDARVSTAEIYQIFRPWQERQGIKTPWTQVAMTRALGEEGGVEVRRVRPSTGGNVVTCVVGRRLFRTV